MKNRVINGENLEQLLKKADDIYTIRGEYSKSCRFLDSNNVCGCKVGERGTPCICTNPGACTLCQTEAEQSRSLHKAWARFSSLSVSKQTMYKNLYYGGKYPWEVQQ